MDTPSDLCQNVTPPPENRNRITHAGFPVRDSPTSAGMQAAFSSTEPSQVERSAGVEGGAPEVTTPGGCIRRPAGDRRTGT